MIKEDLQEEGNIAALSTEELTNFEGKDSFRENIFVQEILSDFLELKREVITLKREVSKNKLMIAQLEKKRDSYGKEVANRVSSMLALINDYGGIMTSKDTKKFMGLSKDEFYRTLRCAKNDNLIELSPNHKDRRSYIIKLKPK
ncbi:Uncharacterised protein [uncultured archaeon]|nr:Uncharacterised protein [uncultured archaeon]